MTSPQDPDDGWADLARELGLESPQPATSRRADAPPPAEDFFTPAADDEGEDALDAGAEAETEDGEGTDAPDDGSPKKKRRRRRRRKKRGTGEPGAEAGTEAEGDSEGESDSNLSVEDEGDAEGSDEDDTEQESEDDAEETRPQEIDRGWANWDVPSWEEIVGGLYRPGR
jgi:hypothetical protein